MITNRHLLKSGLSYNVMGSVMLVLMLLFVGCADKRTPPVIGGECRYDTHAGRARIVSINADEQSDAVDVKFLFLPAVPVTNDLFKPDKPYTMHTRDLTKPTKAFIQTNTLKTGKVIDAEMQIITKGACSPVLFKFPELVEP